MLTKLLPRKKTADDYWPPHSIICDCSKCIRQAKRYIKALGSK